MTQPEIWKDIPGIVGYQASSFGRIRSLDRIVKTGLINNDSCERIGRVLKVSKAKLDKRWGGILTYPSVRISQKGDGKTKTVHRLVALAFIPNPENKPFVCHEDDDPNNSRPDNLFWGTAKDNTQDRVKKGLMKKGSQLVFSKLKEKDVLLIREFIKSKLSDKKIAKKFNRGEATIRDIRKNKTWKHVL